MYPFTVNRAGSMIGFFFTNEEVINYETAKTSNLDFFAAYYREMANQGVFLPPSQFEGCSYQLHIVMKILNKQLQQLKKLFQSYVDKQINKIDFYIKAYGGFRKLF